MTATNIATAAASTSNQFGRTNLRLVNSTDIAILLHPDETNLLNRYIEAKAAEREAKEAVEDLQPSVKSLLADLQTDGHIDKTLIHAGFEFQYKIKNNYSFSPAVQELEARLKALKEAEIKSGAAIVQTETPYVSLVAEKNCN
jgi:hypothetical protein